MPRSKKIATTSKPSNQRALSTLNKSITPRPINPPPNINTETGADDVTNEVNINVRNPVPLELENHYGYSAGGNRYIPFLTFTNDECYGWDTFFNTLLKTRLESSTLDAVLDSKMKFAMGDGIYRKGIDNTKHEDKDWDAFIKICNSEPEGLNAVLQSVIDNFQTYGNAPIEIAKGETAGKKWLSVYSKNALDCRKGWPDGNNQSQAMIISRWFRQRGIMNLTQKFNIRIPFYKMGPGLKDDCWVQDSKDNQGKDVKPVWRTALWVRNKYPGYDHYGLPSWIASLIHANLEYRGSVYNYDNLKNGMNVGGILTVEGNLAPGEQKKMAKDLKNTFSGVGHGGRTMVAASTDALSKTDWKPFNTHKDGSFIDLAALSKDSIIMNNSWDGAFLGNKDGMTKAKSGAYLNELYQQKIKTVIAPLHKIIIEQFITPLMEIADEWLGTDWSKYDLDIQVSNLFNDTTEASTTVNGAVALTNILKLVGDGTLPHENAVFLLSFKWGMQLHEAEKIVNGIKVQTKIKPNIIENT